MRELSADMTQAALRPFRYFVSNDIEQARDRISSVFCPHSLVPDRPMRALEARMDLLNVAGLSFGNLHLGGAMSVSVPAMADCYLMLFCLRGASTVLTEGAELAVSGKRGFVCNPGQRFQANFSADAEQLFLRVEHRILWKHTGAQQLRLESQIDLSRPALAPAEALIRMLLSSPGTIGLMQGNPRIAGDYEQLLVSLLLAGQPHVDEFKARRSGIAPSTVRRAEAFIRSNAAAPITLNDIADAAGVPVRTLLDAFHRFREMSPIRMVRDVRLELAREELERDGGGTVADIAMNSGFGHLGRFAQAYAERFGELPSDTRARRRGAARSGHTGAANRPNATSNAAWPGASCRSIE